MKVWIAILSHWYESSEILAVCTSREGAIRFLERYTSRVDEHVFGLAYERKKEDYWENTGTASLEIEEHGVIE